MKAVLFDMDGTLIDSSPGITRSVQYALRHFGIDEPDLVKLHVFIGPPLRKSFAEHYGFSEEQAAEAVKLYRERYNVEGIFECSLYPGVEECIRALRAAGFLLGVASSKPEESCKRILEHFGVLPLFDEVVGATMDGRIDTKEQVLRELMWRWPEILPEEMCLVGDTMFDLEGAKTVGIDCVAVSFGFGDARAMCAAGAVAVCDDMRRLPELVRRMSKEANRAGEPEE